MSIRQSNRGIADELEGSACTPIPSASPAVSASLTTRPCLFFGWSVRETAGAAATVELYDGSNATGRFVAAIALAANGAETDPGPDGGLLCESGLYLNVVSGSAKVSAWLKR